MKLEELKSKLVTDLEKAGMSMSPFDKMQVALNLKIALATVSRYTSGVEHEVRNLVLAESILSETKNVLATKATA